MGGRFMPQRRTTERPEMILVAMHKLSSGTTKPLKYEDIVVRAFEMFPDEFALRGYPQYPDSSDIHKPLYGPLKRDGFIRSANKTFALTARGVEQARALIQRAGEKLDEGRDPDRMTRDVKIEVERMLASEAFKLVGAERKDRILDTDLYAFLGCTVRTPKNDFVGRLNATADAVKIAAKLKQPNEKVAELLEETWSHLEQKFKSLIDRHRGAR
jgi:hypothetical protein